MAFADDPEFNPYEAPKGEVVFTPYQQVSALDLYAGFWRRFAAYFIDAIILGVVNWVLNMVVQMPVMLLMDGRPESERMPLLFAVLGFNMVVNLTIDIGYFALMESSASQASVGKMALGIVVTDMYGRRINFSRSLGRAAGRQLSAFLCSIGFLMAVFTDRQQALHDLMASTLVLRRR